MRRADCAGSVFGAININRVSRVGEESRHRDGGRGVGGGVDQTLNHPVIAGGVVGAVGRSLAGRPGEGRSTVVAGEIIERLVGAIGADGVVPIVSGHHAGAFRSAHRRAAPHEINADGQTRRRRRPRGDRIDHRIGANGRVRELNLARGAGVDIGQNHISPADHVVGIGSEVVQREVERLSDRAGHQRPLHAAGRIPSQLIQIGRPRRGGGKQVPRGHRRRAADARRRQRHDRTARRDGRENPRLGRLINPAARILINRGGVGVYFHDQIGLVVHIGLAGAVGVAGGVDRQRGRNAVSGQPVALPAL